MAAYRAVNGAIADHGGAWPRGQALVETAIALPIILVLSLAAFDLGRGIVAHIALTEATQDGAFWAAYEYGDLPAGTAVNTVEGRVTSTSNADVVTGADVTVPLCTTSPAPGRIVVRSTSDIGVTSPPAQAIFGPAFTLTVEVSATNFNGACP
jgi:Flp pilus assembly protein TadG